MARHSHPHHDVPVSATRGLFWAWLVHDAEEAATMGPWSRRHLPGLARRVTARPPGAPGTSPWAPRGLSERHVRLSVSMMGCVMLALAERGRASGGGSRLFQAGLLGFGVHGLTHVLGSAVWRGYTPGVVTAPTVVIPFSAWALGQLARNGVLRLDSRTVTTALAGLPAVVLAAHCATALLVGGGRHPGSGRSGQPQ